MHRVKAWGKPYLYWAAALALGVIFPPGGLRNARTGEVVLRSDTTERWKIGDPVLHGYSLDDSR